MRTKRRVGWVAAVLGLMGLMGLGVVATVLLDGNGALPPLAEDERVLADAGIEVMRVEFAREDLVECGSVAGRAIYDYAAGSGAPSEYEAVVRFVANGIQRSDAPRPEGRLAPGPEDSTWVYVSDDRSRQVVYGLSEYEGRFVVGSAGTC